MTPAVYRGENAGGTGEESLRGRPHKGGESRALGSGGQRRGAGQEDENRAHILLSADEARTDKHIAQALHTSPSTVERTRRRFVEGGLEHALNESPRPGGKRKLDGHKEAYLMALACSNPPEGKKRWSMQMLADRLVKLKVVDEISDETVRRMLKKGTLSRG